MKLGDPTAYDFSRLDLDYMKNDDVPTGLAVTVWPQ